MAWWRVHDVAHNKPQHARGAVLLLLHTVPGRMLFFRMGSRCVFCISRVFLDRRVTTSNDSNECGSRTVLDAPSLLGDSQLFDFLADGTRSDFFYSFITKQPAEQLNIIIHSAKCQSKCGTL